MGFLKVLSAFSELLVSVEIVVNAVESPVMVREGVQNFNVCVRISKGRVEPGTNLSFTQKIHGENGK